MYHATKQKSKKYLYSGFSLIELLVAIAIIGIISVISVQGLYDIVSIRAKQQTIEDSSDNFRIVARLITKAVIEAERVSVPNSQEIRLTNNNDCQTIKYDIASNSMQHAKLSSPCTPPDADFVNITNEDFVITNFTLSPTGNPIEVILLEMEGYYENSLSDHPIKYSTTISKRI